MSNVDENDNIYMSKQGITYISFVNINNCLCFYNTCLHLLKTSKTLTNMLTTNKQLSDYATQTFPTLFKPLYLYCVNTDKHTIEQTIYESCNKLTTCGYVVEWLLNNYYFPIIYHLLIKFSYDEITLLNIWREMSLEKHFLKTTDKSANVFISDEDNKVIEELKTKYNHNLTKLLNKYNDDNLSYDCVIMEVYPNNKNNGHVAVVIDGEYILDREKCCSFSKYINEELTDLHKLRFDYTKPNFVNHIKNLKLEKMLYSYVYLHKNNMPPNRFSFVGGDKDKPSCNKGLLIFLVILNLVIIVLLIVAVVYIVALTSLLKFVNSAKSGGGFIGNFFDTVGEALKNNSNGSSSPETDEPVIPIEDEDIETPTTPQTFRPRRRYY